MRDVKEMTPDELRAENRAMATQMDRHRRHEAAEVPYPEAIARREEIRRELADRGEVLGQREADALKVAGPGPRPVQKMRM